MINYFQFCIKISISELQSLDLSQKVVLPYNGSIAIVRTVNLAPDRLASIKYQNFLACRFRCSKFIAYTNKRSNSIRCKDE